MKVFVLVVSSTSGSVDRVLDRVAKINKSGDFGALLCIGTFHNEKDQRESKYLNGSSSLPIDVFVFGSIPSGVDKSTFPEKLHYLGNNGHTTIGTLTVGYFIEENHLGDEVGSKRERNDSNEEFEFLKKTLKDNGPFDILISSLWPEGIISNLEIKDYPSDLSIKGIRSPTVGCSKVKELNEICTPRYHFATSARSSIALPSSPVYYERLPFRHSDASYICRFISLPNVGTKGQKWLYASNISPLAEMSEEQLNTIPENTTPSPFIQNEMKQPNTKQRKLNSSEQLEIDGAYNRFGNLDTGKQNSSKSHKRGKTHQGPPKTIDNCWFCMDSDKVAEHLITSIGDECYLALPKGSIVPDHVLIIPLDHVTIPSSMTQETISEINKYKSSLKQFAEKQNKGIVFFERNVKTQYGMVHYLIQCIPLAKKYSSDDIQRKFEEIGGKYRMTYKIIASSDNSNINSFVKSNDEYFLAELPDGRRLLHIVPSNARHPLQLGREVIAEILNKPERKNWKECELTKKAEESLATKFKEGFKPFDFTTQ